MSRQLCCSTATWLAALVWLISACGGRSVAPLGPCGDLSTDSKNCGRCGHDCLGGACYEGACQPIVLSQASSSAEFPWAIAVDETDVFWSTGVGDLVKCSKSSCGAPVALAKGEPSPIDAIVVDETDVIWANYNGAIMKCPKGGCDRPTRLATGQYLVLNMATDGTDLYWAANDAVMKCALAGCNETPVRVTPLDQGGPSAVALDSTSVYWTASGGVKACPKVGCQSPLVLSSSRETSLHIVVDRSMAFWTTNGGAILGCSVHGCGDMPTTLATGAFPFGIVADDANVYWTNFDDGTVRSCATSGCGQRPITVASGQEWSHGLAMDDASIFWTSGRNGTVMRLAK